MAQITGPQKNRGKLKAARAIVICFIFLFSSACHYEAIKHDPKKAALDTNRFLKTLYFDENPSEALKFCDEQVGAAGGADALTRMINKTKQDRGQLRSLVADSYLMAPGSGIELYYVGTYEKGVLYHRLVVLGDVSAGYKVAGLWFKDDAYPQTELRLKFEPEIPVQ